MQMQRGAEGEEEGGRGCREQCGSLRGLGSPGGYSCDGLLRFQQDEVFGGDRRASVTDGGQGKASEGHETDERASFRVALFFYGRP